MKQTALIFAFLSGVSCALAQAPQSGDVFFYKQAQIGPEQEAPGPVFIQRAAGPMTTGVAVGANFEFVGAEMGFGGKPVKGAPYAGEGITEATQMLPDGNRITRKTSALFYRDAEGRTRNEQTLGAIGPWASASNPPRTIMINDPVAGVQYILNPDDRSAHKLPGAAGAIGYARFPGPPGAQDQKPMDVKTESLGTQMIEGVQAQGTRTVITIPAGQIGNEKDIQTVSERWYSPELQVVVMRKQSDPRFGDTVYRLTNVQRADQPSALFEVPSDYTVRDEPAVQFKSPK